MKRFFVLLMALVCFTPPSQAFGWPFNFFHKENHQHTHTMPAGKSADFHINSSKQPVNRQKKIKTSVRYSAPMQRVYSAANYRK